MSTHLSSYRFVCNRSICDISIWGSGTSNDSGRKSLRSTGSAIFAVIGGNCAISTCIGACVLHLWWCTLFNVTGILNRSSIAVPMLLGLNPLLAENQHHLLVVSLWGYIRMAPNVMTCSTRVWMPNVGFALTIFLRTQHREESLKDIRVFSQDVAQTIKLDLWER